MRGISSVIHPADRLWQPEKGRDAAHGYFHSAMLQAQFLADRVISQRLRRQSGDRLSVADYACHYGRLTRALAAYIPRADIFAYDIDREALAFCASQFDATPVSVDWFETGVPKSALQHDLLVSASLLTHTRLSFDERVMQFWSGCIRPGGLLVFTYLGPELLERWMQPDGLGYGDAPVERKLPIRAAFLADRHGFMPQSTPYSGSGDYGMGFLHPTLVARLCETAGFSILEHIPWDKGWFGQDVVVALRSSSTHPA